jgi:hypothetical protein
MSSPLSEEKKLSVTGFLFLPALCAEEFDELLTSHFARTTNLQGQR